MKLELSSGGNLKKLRGYIDGPTDSPYQGGLFEIDIELMDDYPFSPPKVLAGSCSYESIPLSGGCVNQRPSSVGEPSLARTVRRGHLWLPSWF